MVRLISFGDKQFRRSLLSVKKTAGRFGVDEVCVYSKAQFSATDFFKQNRHIAGLPRGAGYWLWKPYYILENLLHMAEGDVLVYMDAGVSVVADLHPLISIAQQSAIVLFQNCQGSDYIRQTNLPFNYQNVYTEINSNKFWCKRDVFVALDADTEAGWNSPNVDASFMVVRVCPAAISFVQLWLHYCLVPGLITDAPNASSLDNFPGMINHLHDQSILSVLAFREGIELYRSPSQFGNHYKLPENRIAGEFIMLPYADEPKINSPYGTLLLHHRMRDIPFKLRLKHYVRNELKIFDELYFGGILKSKLGGK